MEVAVKKVVIVRVQHAFKVGKFYMERWPIVNGYPA